MGDEYSAQAPPAAEWSTVGAIELLDADPRPTFVVDIEAQLPRIVYRNAAFATDYDYEDVVWRDFQHQCEEFKRWATSSTQAPTFYYRDITWTAALLRGKWKVINGTPPAADSPSSSPRRRNAREGPVAEHVNLNIASSDRHDWTGPEPPKTLSPHTQFLREWNWSATPLGPVQSWSPILRSLANLVNVDPNPAVLFWGPKMAHVYNQPYISMLKTKHPQALGQPYLQTWPELYENPETADLLDQLWIQGRVHGKATLLPHQCFFILNDGLLVERFFNITVLPVIGESGEAVGFYEPFTEITTDYLNERRSATVRRIGELTVGDNDPATFFKKLMTALEENDRDVPFAIAYSITHDRSRGSPNEFNLVEALDKDSIRLESHLNIPIDPSDHSVGTSVLFRNNAFCRTFETVIQNGKQALFDLEPWPSLQQALMIEGSTRGFGEKPRAAVLCPIEPTTHRNLSGVLVLGINPRRPYDTDYEIFIRTLSRTISSSLASVLLVMEQKRMVQAAAERTEEAQEMEQRALAMIETSSVGSFLMTMDGQMLYANQAWKDIIGYEGNEFGYFDWIQLIADNDQQDMYRMWEGLVETEVPAMFEVRFKKPWSMVEEGTGRILSGPRVAMCGVAIKEIRGKKLTTGSITDISRLKWAEGEQMRMKEEALEMKRQQETFIDMTSHEMRNPLSAIFQCADAIVSTLEAYRKPGSTFASASAPSSSEDPITFAIESASTITLCAQHQKRIVDDVLVLSKVDANLIEITPVDVQPRVLAQNALHIFTAELAANGARMTVEIEDSFASMEVDWVKVDPGRLLQVLINLCTNAIKFTAGCSRRDITISLGASRERPVHSSNGVTYFTVSTPDSNSSTRSSSRSASPPVPTPRSPGSLDPTTRPDWGTGEALYLTFQVTDTGKGMSAAEISQLFQRFRQASPRTHTQYGGSGLGLWIARLLAQLQGGEVGVRSAPGVGSTFAFYVRVRRSPGPEGSASAAAAAVQAPIVAEVEVGVGAAPPAEMQRGRPRRSPADVAMLIVEDNVVNQRVLARQLRALGFAVHVANNGREALAFLRRSARWAGPGAVGADAPDVTLLLMDVEMPVMSGTEATREIRRLEGEGSLAPRVPIVAITGNARNEHVAVAMQSGMDGVISKPFRIAELLAKLETFVGPINISDDKPP